MNSKTNEITVKYEAKKVPYGELEHGQFFYAWTYGEKPMLQVTGGCVSLINGSYTEDGSYFQPNTLVWDVPVGSSITITQG